MEVYQARIQTSPQSEQRYAELQREQQLARAKYDEMAKKESMSTMASNLEARKAVAEESERCQSLHEPAGP
jgi:hypothetical protein